MHQVISYSFFSLFLLFTIALFPLKTYADSKSMTGQACDSAIPNTPTTHPNLSVMKKLNIQNLDASRDVIAENFIWHYFNPRLPELHGDYHGLEGYKDFFAKLHKISKGSFQSTVVNRSVIGDELVIIQTCNRLALEAFEGDTIETDVIVVWRIVNGQITEGWDIPSIYSVRVIEQN